MCLPCLSLPPSVCLSVREKWQRVALPSTYSNTLWAVSMKKHVSTASHAPALAAVAYTSRKSPATIENSCANPGEGGRPTPGGVRHAQSGACGGGGVRV